MLKPRFVVVSFFSGLKGGTGKSTLASNTAIALSQALKSNVLLIDLGMDSTATSSRILGVNPDKHGAADYINGTVDDVDQVISRSPVMPSVYVVPPGMLRTWQLNVDPETTQVRFSNLINHSVMKTVAQAVIIDLPAHMDQAITVNSLLQSSIINIVLDYATYSDSVAQEIDKYFIQPMLLKGFKKIVNIVLNKAIPGLDVMESKVRSFIHNGEFFVLPMSPIVHYLTSIMKPLIMYSPKGSLADFRIPFDKYVDTLTKQIKAILTGTY
ncbi:ParA family protein [Vulcanisaeta distributa]|uniref:ATPase involved in chromosome partitioning n=1 Tax=Vulcanisaeta distributa (strain DSM 14429 / JCM 11212 / NBRC 100878 / IC-017) TaxID=572478 RepID=E1QQD7_VULDI|nr:ParA family protein [Vulcanisaeta distributa]ADN51624.1 ATPase involved in chromosome partitioning [Vulcanisaeta distributa DSM 14429]